VTIRVTALNYKPILIRHSYSAS